MTTDDDSWVPDIQTIRWASGILHEDHIIDALSAEVADRQGDLETGSREWWTLVASIAVEHVTFDLSQQATAWTARVTGGD